ncbi:MAG: hypothetical protein OFPII_30710 [Osedax symbiont Rs1]|nr:MAG: hypothetical protein OFPII_30710 [Osedax symbiont Rs1]
MNSSLEMVTFKLAANTSAEQLLDTSAAMESFLQRQEGFLYRSLSHDDNDLWYDIIYWKDQHSAKAGGAAFMKSEVCAAMMPLLDQPSCKVIHMDALSEVLATALAA